MGLAKYLIKEVITINPIKANLKTTYKSLFSHQETGVIIGFIILFVVLSIMSPIFLTVDNLLNVAMQTSIYIVLGVGMTFVIITGGIDLSAGAIAAFSGIIMALSMKGDISVLLSIIFALFLGGICGLVNGAAVAKIGLPPFIVTLATMSIIRGLGLILTSGIPIYGFPAAFRWFGRDRIGIFPVAAIIALIIAVLGIFLSKKTKMGHYITAVGSNKTAAGLCGINTKWYNTLAYIINGFTASIAAIIITSRLNTAEPLAAYMIELDVIAAVVMGGTSLAGGKGSILGTIIGALIMGTLKNGLTLLGVSSYYQQLVMGFVILAAVSFDKLRTTNT